MILFSSGMGVAIEAWKITKAVDIKLVPAQAGSLLPYKLSVTDKHVLSEDEQKTKEYDKLAYKVRLISSRTVSRCAPLGSLSHSIVSPTDNELPSASST
jgi:hypothetical protein